MKFSERWLREWVDPPLDPATLQARLTMAGLEIESSTPVAPPFDCVVVGRIVSAARHPDADRLQVCQVDVGAEALLTIVCGAPNARADLLAPVALPGAVLPGGLQIRASRLRGVDSAGMLCSAKELGLAESSDGLLELPAGLTVGQNIRQALDLDDCSLEINLTPNRGDCLGVLGVAREVAVLTACPLQPPSMPAVAAVHTDSLPIELAAPSACPRYVGRIVHGVRNDQPSPWWLRERLRRSGVRSLSPVVDITNLVLLELGQPMHAFALDRLHGGIVVRMATAGESLTLLNGQTLSLDADTLVIADQQQAVALAGIMGGEGSAVQADTHSVFLESAFFAPMALAGRARRHGLHTDASHRYERGVDPELQVQAMERATALLVELCGGQPGPLLHAVATTDLPSRPTVTLRHQRLEAVLGLRLPASDIESILSRLGMQVNTAGEGVWNVVPPSHRFDIAIEADLIEEVGRVHGYEHLPANRPSAPVQLVPRPEAWLSCDRLADVLVDRGYHQAITFSFVDPAMQQRLDPDCQPLALANPIASDLAVMRTQLWAGLLDAVRRNRNRQMARVRLFEHGLVFRPGNEGLLQEPHLAGVLTGPVWPEQWGAGARLPDFFDVKGDVEALLTLTGEAKSFMFTKAKHPALHPGQSAQVLRNGQPCGWVGMLHPALLASLDLEGPVGLFELALPVLQAASLPRFQPLSRFPAIRRDLAVVVAEDVAADDVLQQVRKVAGEWLRELVLFDVYRGGNVPSGHKSLAFGAVLQAFDTTLTDGQVDALLGSVMTELQTTFAASLRV